MAKQYEGPRPKRRPNPENKNEVGRCKARVATAHGMTRCDLRKDGHTTHQPRPHGAQRRNGK